MEEWNHDQWSSIIGQEFLPTSDKVGWCTTWFIKLSCFFWEIGSVWKVHKSWVSFLSLLNSTWYHIMPVVSILSTIIMSCLASCCLIIIMIFFTRILSHRIELKLTNTAKHNYQVLSFYLRILSHIRLTINKNFRFKIKQKIESYIL